MHELSLCRGLLGEVTRVAKAHGATSVAEIVVDVGPLSGVEPPLLTRAFNVARVGTLAENATLAINRVPARVWCPACQAETEAAANALLCGRCGTWQVHLKSGNELNLTRLDLVTPEATPDPAPVAAAG